MLRNYTLSFALRASTVAALVLLARSSAAQNLQTDSTNGISVGKPKVFDNRSLSIMLDQLSAQLRAVQAIDATKLSTALGNQQGAESRSFAIAASLTGPSLPSVTTKQTNTAGSLTTERDTTSDATKPAAPASPALPAAPAYSPTFGTSAGDLLADQVNLSYQVFNLRMLLERALTDRLINGQARLQAVLGFQVSIDPPKNARDHAAYVEITINSATGRQEPSLVALMPYEKTYNSSAVSTNAAAFGGSAVVQMFTLGVSAQQQSQVFYLFRDADTLALERMQKPASAPEGSVAFGWEFRPVLGRRSVSPGVRQMFAVLALPAADAQATEEVVEVTVRTFWRKYDHKTLSTSGRDDFVRGPYPYGPLSVYGSRYYETQLAPRVSRVRWYTTGPDSAVVSFSGANFFPGTQILIGGTAHSGVDSGLLIKSDSSMELTTTLHDIAFGDAFISGRYGTGITGPAADTSSNATEPRPVGILINQIEVERSPGHDQAMLIVDLQERYGNDLHLGPDDQPLITVGDTVLPGAYDVQPRPGCAAIQIRNAGVQRKDCVRLIAFVKSALVAADARVGVRYPFWGPLWAHAETYAGPSLTVSRQGGKPDTILLISGRTFDDAWQLRLKKAYRVTDDGPLQIDSSRSLLFFRLGTKELDKYKQLVVLPPAPGPGKPPPAPIVVDIPQATAEPAKAVVDLGRPPKSVARASSAAIDITGTGLGSIKTATFEDEQLPFQAAKDGSKLTVILSRAVTRKAGKAIVLLHPASGDFIPVEITVTP
jgi:hypothetical protein